MKTVDVFSLRSARRNTPAAVNARGVRKYDMVVAINVGHLLVLFSCWSIFSRPNRPKDFSSKALPFI